MTELVDAINRLANCVSSGVMVISSILFLILLCKDTSGSTHLRNIYEVLKKWNEKKGD